ncbi:MAG: hypothetical protein AAF196_18700 [Planctomycetota bacterium]
MSDKFEWREPRPPDCTDEERDRHLRAFINAFVASSRREGAAHLLRTYKGRSRQELNTVLGWSREDRRTVLDGSTGFPQHLEQRFGDALGVDVRNSMKAIKLNAAEAACKAVDDLSGAILSLDPGALALVFYDPGPPSLLRV